MIEAPIDGLNINEQPVRDFEPDITLNLPHRAEGFRGTLPGLFGGPVTNSIIEGEIIKTRLVLRPFSPEGMEALKRVIRTLDNPNAVQEIARPSDRILFGSEHHVDRVR